MDKMISAGIIIVFVIVVGIVGVILFNSMNPKILGVSNPIISSCNQTTGNNTTTNNILPSTNILLPLIPFSMSYNGHSTPTSPNPTPKPDPTPDPMDHIISLFDAYLTSNYDQSLIPGMAVVIVQNDKIIYMNTLGVKDLSLGEPVDENTLFGIGSTTKQFTATNIAQLVSEGNMGWDDSIVKYYSDKNEFQLYNDYVTNHITIRDCLCHRSGLPAYGGDDYYTYFNDSYSTALYKLRYMENNTSFRSTFEYNNILYALPGYCAAREQNTTWNELIKKNLLDPLGMTATVTSYWDFLSSPNHVTPYYLLQNGTMKQYDIIPDPIGPAGSIYSSISEMVHWLKFQVADTGYYNGVKIVNKTELDETRTPQINMFDGTYYGFGWEVQNDRIFHNGASDSFRSTVIVYPSKGIGMILLSNGGTYAQAFNECLDAKFRDLLNGIGNTDPWPKVKEITDDYWKPVAPTPPIVNQTLPLSGYVGVYSNNLFSNINITTSNNTLICYYGNNSQPFDLKHWNGDVFEEPTNNHFFNFTGIYNGTAHQVDVTLTNTPENTTFNRTNST